MIDKGLKWRGKVCRRKGTGAERDREGEKERGKVRCKILKEGE